MTGRQACSQLWGQLGSGPHKMSCAPRINGPVSHKLINSHKLIIASPSSTQSLTLETFKSETSYKCVNSAHYIGQKLHYFLDQKCSVTQKYAKKAFSAGAPPDLRLGSSRLSPDTLVGWGGDTCPTPLSLFGAWILARSVLATCAPAHKPGA